MRLERRAVGTASAVGLEIASTAVRAAEVTRSRRGLALRSFAEVPLTPGVVVEGEIRDLGATVGALRELWSRGGFKTRRVNLCISGPRVIVRQAEVVAMSAGDFRSSLQFQAAELIPLPMDHAVVDFSILPGGDPPRIAPGKMQVLIAAAHREMVDRHLSALREASLTAVGIDTAPVAAVRLARHAGLGGGPVGIVDLSDDLAVIVVTEANVVRFSRIQTIGADVAEAGERFSTGRESSAPYAQSDGNPLRSRDTTPQGAPVLVASQTDDRQVASLIGKVAGSLTYFTGELAAGALDEVLLTGDRSASSALVAGLASRVAAPCRPFDALHGLDLSGIALSEHERLVASSRGALVIGAAQCSFEPAGARLSLLPREMEAAAAARRKLVAAGVGALVVVAGLGALSYHQHREVHSARQDAARIAAANDALQSQIDTLMPISSTHAAIEARLAEVGSSASDDEAWSSLLSEISAAMPPGATLTNISFQAAAGGGATSPTTASSASSTANGSTDGAIGTVTMSVRAQGNEDQVAVWLRALSKVKGLAAVWVPGSSSGAGTVTFTSTASITTDAPQVIRSSTGAGVAS